MAQYGVRCLEAKCFQNFCGTYCKLLTDYTDTQPCPFMKTQEQVDEERLKAHKKLEEKGLQDLIDIYEYNPMRRSSW